MDGRPRVMIVGPGRGGAGGIAVVIETLVASSLADRYEVLQVATHTNSGATRKALRALTGIAHAAYLLALRRVDLVYCTRRPALRCVASRWWPPSRDSRADDTSSMCTREGSIATTDPPVGRSSGS
jgi:hypothetical protein